MQLYFFATIVLKATASLLIAFGLKFHCRLEPSNTTAVVFANELDCVTQRNGPWHRSTLMGHDGKMVNRGKNHASFHCCMSSCLHACLLCMNQEFPR